MNFHTQYLIKIKLNRLSVCTSTKYIKNDYEVFVMTKNEPKCTHQLSQEFF